MMSNTSFSATVVTLPSAGVAIPARLTIAVPTNTQWKGRKSWERWQGQEMQHDVWLDTSFLWYLHKTSEKDSKHTSLTFRLLWLNWPIHYLKAHTLHTKRIHLYKLALVESCSLIKIQIPYPATFPLRFLHPNSLKTQNPVPACNWNSLFPLLFLAPIPNIATKISQIPHPAKPIVDPLSTIWNPRLPYSQC